LEYAYDPKSRCNLTVDEYKDVYGPKMDDRGNMRTRPTLRCLACNVSLHTVSEDSSTTVPTWGHDPNKEIFCPIKSAGATRYELLPPIDADPLTGIRLRTAFFAHWEQHWGFIRHVAPLADIFTLIGFLRAADHRRFWDQRHFEEWHLPYVFLATCDFPPPKGKAANRRAEWLRFRFDGRYRTLQDLWIRAAPGFNFLRLRYHAPVRKREPGPADFIVAEPVSVAAAWMAESFAPPHRFAVTQMQNAFLAR